MEQLRRDHGDRRVRFADVFIGELARTLARGIVAAAGVLALEVARHFLT